jgi:hypothetical protein
MAHYAYTLVLTLLLFCGLCPLHGQSKKDWIELLSQQRDSLLRVQEANTRQYQHQAEQLSSALQSLRQQNSRLKDSIRISENLLPTLKTQINQSLTTLNQLLEKSMRHHNVMDFIHAQGEEETMLTFSVLKADPGRKLRRLSAGFGIENALREIVVGDYNNDQFTDYLYIYDVSDVLYYPVKEYYLYDGQSQQVRQLTLGNGPELTMTLSNISMSSGQLRGRLDLYYGNGSMYEGPEFIPCTFTLRGNKLIIPDQYLPKLQEIYRHMLEANDAQ